MKRKMHTVKKTAAYAFVGMLLLTTAYATTPDDSVGDPLRVLGQILKDISPALPKDVARPIRSTGNALDSAGATIAKQQRRDTRSRNPDPRPYQTAQHEQPAFKVAQTSNRINLPATNIDLARLRKLTGKEVQHRLNSNSAFSSFLQNNKEYYIHWNSDGTYLMKSLEANNVDRKGSWQLSTGLWRTFNDQDYLCFSESSPSPASCYYVFEDNEGHLFTKSYNNPQSGHFIHQYNIVNGDPERLSEFKGVNCLWLQYPPSQSCCIAPPHVSALNKFVYESDCRARANGWKPPTAQERAALWKKVIGIALDMQAEQSRDNDGHLQEQYDAYRLQRKGIFK